MPPVRGKLSAEHLQITTADLRHLGFQLDVRQGPNLFGEAADLIERALQSESENGEITITYQKCASLKEAVHKAADIAESGDVVLLSPGGTSFDEFIDFAERGEKFRKWIQELS